MESFESAPGSAQPGQTDRYGQEVLCASWNPQVSVLTEPAEQSEEALPGQGGADAASFLIRYYRSQCA